MAVLVIAVCHLFVSSSEDNCECTVSYEIFLTELKISHALHSNLITPSNTHN